VVGFCVYGNKPSESTKVLKFLGQLSNCYIFKCLASMALWIYFILNTAL